MGEVTLNSVTLVGVRLGTERGIAQGRGVQDEQGQVKREQRSKQKLTTMYALRFILATTL